MSTAKSKIFWRLIDNIIPTVRHINAERSKIKFRLKRFRGPAGLRDGPRATTGLGDGKLGWFA